MDKAKAAINDFMSNSGHHDTTVHETVAPAVKKEVVKPHLHEEINTAIDKEVHQDHYHRTIQPVKDLEVLPEQHTAQLGAVQHREFDHRETDVTKRNLAAEQAAFKDERVVESTTQSQSAAAAVAGEHVHHHIHETIQPVVHKEVIQPQVVHTTVPIHEVHHNAATHHEASELPAMTMSEFKSKGGVLGGRGERYDGFEGEPKHIGGTMAHMMEGHKSKRDSGHDEQLRVAAMHGDFDPLDGRQSNARSGERVAQTAEEANRAAAQSERVHASSVGVGATGAASRTGNVSRVEEHGARHGSAANDLRHSKTPVGNDMHHSSSDAASTKSKASFLDKLNPRKDADGDGKAGFMS